MQNEIKVDRTETGENRFYHKYEIKPFGFNYFPMDKDRFSIAILAKENTKELKNMLTYIINSYDSNCERIKSENILDLKKELSDYNKSSEELKNKWAIVDCTTTGKFKELDPNIIPLGPIAKCDWLINYYVLTCNFPNFKLKFFPDADKNFSHIIWLTDEIKSRRTLFTNSALTFILDNDNVDKFMDEVINTQNFKSNHNFYYILGKHMRINEQILTISKARFKNS